MKAAYTGIYEVVPYGDNSDSYIYELITRLIDNRMEVTPSVFISSVNLYYSLDNRPTITVNLTSMCQENLTKLIECAVVINSISTHLSFFKVLTNIETGSF